MTYDFVMVVPRYLDAQYLSRQCFDRQSFYVVPVAASVGGRRWNGIILPDPKNIGEYSSLSFRENYERWIIESLITRLTPGDHWSKRVYGDPQTVVRLLTGQARAAEN